MTTVRMYDACITTGPFSQQCMAEEVPVYTAKRVVTTLLLAEAKKNREPGGNAALAERFQSMASTFMELPAGASLHGYAMRWTDLKGQERIIGIVPTGEDIFEMSGPEIREADRVTRAQAAHFEARGQVAAPPREQARERIDRAADIAGRMAAASRKAVTE